MSVSYYHIFSKLDGEPNVGIWYLLKEQEQQGAQAIGQPVRIGADLVEWVAARPIHGGGPNRLGPGPYRHTTDLEGQVFATNESFRSRDWFLIPANEENTYLIAADPRANFVWTAVASGEPVKIEPFIPGNPNQSFKIVPVRE